MNFVNIQQARDISVFKILGDHWRLYKTLEKQQQKPTIDTKQMIHKGRELFTLCILYSANLGIHTFGSIQIRLNIQRYKVKVAFF